MSLIYALKGFIGFPFCLKKKNVVLELRLCKGSLDHGAPGGLLDACPRILVPFELHGAKVWQTNGRGEESFLPVKCVNA